MGPLGFVKGKHVHFLSSCPQSSREYSRVVARVTGPFKDGTATKQMKQLIQISKEGEGRGRGGPHSPSLSLGQNADLLFGGSALSEGPGHSGRRF